MLTNTNYKKMTMLSLIGSFFTFFTFFAGAPFWRVFRKETSALLYYAITTVIVVGLWQMNLAYFSALIGSLFLIVGLQYDLEKKIKNPLYNGLVVILINVLFLASCYSVWIFQHPSFDAVEFVTTAITQLPQLKQVSIDPKVIVSQMPSVVLVIMILTLASAIIFENRVNAWFGILSQQTFRGSLLTFAVPDFFVWIALASFLASFIKVQNHLVNVIGTNVLNVMYILYFLQGIAVAEVCFKVFRVGQFLRVVAYFLLLTQAFIVISVVGFIDYWINFRSRFAKIKAAKV